MNWEQEEQAIFEEKFLNEIKRHAKAQLEILQLNCPLSRTDVGSRRLGNLVKEYTSMHASACRGYRSWDLWDREERQYSDMPVLTLKEFIETYDLSAELEDILTLGKNNLKLVGEPSVEIGQPDRYSGNDAQFIVVTFLVDNSPSEVVAAKRKMGLELYQKYSGEESRIQYNIYLADF